MTNQSLIIAVAKLDGIKTDFMQGDFCMCETCCEGRGQGYLTSRDAIIPVIEKQPAQIKLRVIEKLMEINKDYSPSLECFVIILLSTPKQLSIALVKATEKWEE